MSDEAGKTNSVQSTTRKIDLFGGGDIPTHRRLPYGYDHYPHSPITYPLLTVSFSAKTDFITLADHCERLAETLTETHDPALKLVLCDRLAACLALLRPTLNEPIPPHLTERLMVNTLPAASSCAEHDSELLCDYSFALAQLMVGYMLPQGISHPLTVLLGELVRSFAAGLKAPRWVRTADGVTFIDEVAE